MKLYIKECELCDNTGQIAIYTTKGRIQLCNGCFNALDKYFKEL